MFTKKILALSLLWIASVGAFPKSDALVKLTVGPHLANYLKDLQSKFEAAGVKFSFKPRVKQFHITLNYISDAYSKPRNENDSGILSEIVIPGVMDAGIKEVKDMKIGEAALFGDHLVVKVVGPGAEQLETLHNGIFSELGRRREVAKDSREYVPHISLGIVTNKDSVSKALKDVSISPMKFSNNRYVFSFYALDGKLHEETGSFDPEKAWELFSKVNKIEGL